MKVYTPLRLLLLTFVGTAVFLWKAPHVGLLARVARGDFAGASVPVTVFVIERFPEPTVCLRLGPLTINVPPDMIGTDGGHNGHENVSFEREGFLCLLLSPRRLDPAQMEDRDDWSRRLACFGGDEVALTVAAYQASPCDLSFGMTAAQVQSLETRLEARRCSHCRRTVLNLSARKT